MSAPGGRLSRWVYNGLAVPASRVALGGLARVRPRLAREMAARKGVEARWEAAAARTAGRGPRIWVHAASAGETLQARPLVEAIRGEQPEAAIFASYFSTSAERVHAGWPVPDAADYLPFDFPRSVRRVVEAIDPGALVLVSGELWPNLVWTAAERGTLLAQVCCRVAGGSRRLRPPLRALTRLLYREFRAIAVVAPEDADRLREAGIPSKIVGVTGDTRIDATLARLDAARAEPPPWRPAPDVGPVVVAGSTWPADEAVLLEAVARLRREHPRLIAVIAPHEPTPDAIERLIRKARAHGLQAGLITDEAPSGEGPAVLIVDRIGILYRLYGVADLAYVGGGFGGAVHNTLEPAAHAVPVVTGSDHGNPHEVQAMRASGGLANVRSTPELMTLWRAWLSDPESRRRSGTAARQFLEDHAGATRRTLDFLRARGLPV
ncbi:MAG TPA: glycosyltransferase N-terminal domain-containing protein [Gemmatimonadota bacterium]|nr:glycosyltransferase N-terminal domain-containing protein [Gemmatimonadota bacterium]